MDATMSAPTTDERPVPAVIDVVLEVEKLLISFVRFNRLGTYIACGAVNGYLAIVDFITKDTDKIWNAHTMAVSGISWARDGRQILSTAIDNTMVISDVATGTVVRQLYIGAALQFAELNPRDPDNYLSLTDSGIRIRTFRTFQKYSQIEHKQRITAITYDHTGNYIVCGTQNGYILTFELNGRQVSECVVDSPSQIKHLYPSRRAGLLIITASDRYIRIAEMATVLRLKSGEELNLVNSLSDASNKSFWHSACASGLADHVAGLCSAAHMVTIWERATNTIVTTLIQSKKEVPTCLVWHPIKPVVASVCNFKLYIWKQKPRPSYAAYAPDFKEIGENMEYQEKESEFDVYDEDCPDDDSANMRRSPDLIDIETVLAPKALCSSDEDESNSHAIFTVVPSIRRPMLPSRPQFPLRMRRKREFEEIRVNGINHTNGHLANGHDYVNGNGNGHEAMQNGHHEHRHDEPLRHEEPHRHHHHHRRHRHRHEREHHERHRHRHENGNGNGAINGVLVNGHKRRHSELDFEERASTSGEEADVEVGSEPEAEKEESEVESSKPESDVDEDMDDDMGVNVTPQEEDEDMEVDKPSSRSRSSSRLRDSQASSPGLTEVSAASARASTPSSSVASDFGSDADEEEDAVASDNDDDAAASSADSDEEDEVSKSDSKSSTDLSSSAEEEEEDPQPTREHWSSRSSQSLSDSEPEGSLKRSKKSVSPVKKAFNSLVRTPYTPTTIAFDLHCTTTTPTFNVESASASDPAKVRYTDSTSSHRLPALHRSATDSNRLPDNIDHVHATTASTAIATHATYGSADSASPAITYDTADSPSSSQTTAASSADPTTPSTAASSACQTPTNTLSRDACNLRFRGERFETPSETTRFEFIVIKWCWPCLG
uniref:WD_REPEATS_REGION domain-containing protein n=1 Tax=Panagrellus redivivus TaxID=6233 RepID=A0A7E4VY31_PANRE